MARKKQGQLTVREAGRKGGQKVKELIEQGKRAAAGPARRGRKSGRK